MIGWMSSFMFYVAYTMASDVSGEPTKDENVQCNVAYTAAYMSVLSGGDCSQAACSASCQQKIDAVDKSCSGQVFNTTDELTGLTLQRSFGYRAQTTLMQMGPPDCVYGDIAERSSAPKQCGPQCVLSDQSQIASTQT